MMAIDRRPWHLWAVGILSALWNSGGAIDFTLTKLRDPAYLAPFSPTERAWFLGFPWWAEAFWAMGVWGAMLGSVLLLLRSRWAIAAFAAALAGVAGTTLYQFVLSAMPASLNTPGGTAFSVAIWVVTGLLLWYVVAMRRRGVLR